VLSRQTDDVVTHTFGDGCGGATSAYSHSVLLTEIGHKNEAITLMETYRSPTAIDLRWINSRNLEVIARGTKDVRLLRLYDKPLWNDVTVTIRLE
jgi:hypothetical protein